MGSAGRQGNTQARNRQWSRIILTEASALSDPTPVRVIFADDHPKQSRLPTTVRADEADAGSGTEMGRGLGQEDAGGEMLTDFFDLEHGVTTLGLSLLLLSPHDSLLRPLARQS